MGQQVLLSGKSFRFSEYQSLFQFMIIHMYNSVCVRGTDILKSEAPWRIGLVGAPSAYRNSFLAIFHIVAGIVSISTSS
jgi:hypothetical protein